MSNKNTQGYSNQNLHTLKEESVNKYKAYAYGDYTVLATSSGIESIIPTNEKPRMIHIYVDSTTASPAIAMRYRVDGGDPVATGSGIGKKNTDDFCIYEFSNIQKLRVIEETANTTVLRVTFYK